MKKELHYITNVLVGDSRKYSLEQRIFNTLSLLCSVFGVLSVIQNLLLQLNFMTVILAGVGMVLLTLYYILSRFKKIYKPLVWPLIMTSTVLIASIWFFNGGSLGGGLLLYLVMMFFFMVLTRGVSRVLAVIWTIFMPLLMLYLEYRHPEIDISYSDPLFRYLDLGITFVIVMGILGVGTSLVISNYRKERTKSEDRAEQLKKKSEEMEKELELAQKIQSRQVPLDYSAPDIGFYYKPMEKVGGDFFDFIEVSDHELGIFLSDVSGHGVPAAFVTSIIKSHTMQHNDLIADPAAFLMYLNNALVNVTASHFVTAFYGIFNKNSREFVFSSAGHPPPLMISKKQISPLQFAGTGFPLAIFDNSQIEKLDRVLQNNRVILEKGSKLLLFTDGLLETVNFQEKKTLPDDHIRDFEEMMLTDVLESNRDLSSIDLVKKIMEELSLFRGESFYDDDVCIISLDV